METLPPEVKKLINGSALKASPTPPPCQEASSISPTLCDREPKLNKTEQRYLQLLLSQGKTILSQSLKLRTGAKNSWYKPDFVVIQMDGPLEIHEVKGPYVWDDARVKFQAAVTIYPHFVWVWAQWKDNQWNIKQYNERKKE